MIKFTVPFVSMVFVSLQAQAGEAYKLAQPCQSDCRYEWQQAQFWLQKHSDMRIQIVSDTLIETYNPPRLRTGGKLYKVFSKNGNGYVVGVLICTTKCKTTLDEASDDFKAMLTN